jgi:hypothetical protein
MGISEQEDFFNTSIEILPEMKSAKPVDMWWLCSKAVPGIG